MNPCFVCGTEPQLKVDSSSVAFLLCQKCNNADYYTLWDINNPIPEPDPLAIAHEQLEACHEFLTAIGTLAESTLDLDGIRNWAAKLLAEQTETNA